LILRNRRKCVPITQPAAFATTNYLLIKKTQGLELEKKPFNQFYILEHKNRKIYLEIQPPDEDIRSLLELKRASPKIVIK